ncbi:MAG: transglutaminase family protein [Proteobacteria bacterium]|nr:transglutaminase family protein [Pseudomonadota bacterium]
MRIRLGYDIAYQCPQPTPMLLLLRVHPSRGNDLETPDLVGVSPDVPVQTYLDGFGNLCSRISAPAGLLRLTGDAVIADPREPDAVAYAAHQIDVRDLPPEHLVYLLGSRYCETDKLSEIAWSLFGNAPMGWGRVQAICDYVHNHIRFDYMQARSTKSAWDVHMERTGVCRDFAHLAVAFCRCMNIPARYCTGYLGDIGVPADPAPMDFSAWFEAYLDHRWYTFDARHNRPRIGRVLIGRGRDAADVPLSNSFGMTTLASFRVWTDEIAG